MDPERAIPPSKAISHCLSHPEGYVFPPVPVWPLAVPPCLRAILCPQCLLNLQEHTSQRSGLTSMLSLERLRTARIRSTQSRKQGCF